MSILGLIGMPSLMSGMMLEVGSPSAASRMEITVMLLSSAAVMIGSVVAVLLSSWSLVNHKHQLTVMHGSLSYR